MRALFECGFMRDDVPHITVERCMVAEGFKKGVWNGWQMKTKCEEKLNEPLCLTPQQQVPRRDVSKRLTNAYCLRNPFQHLCMVENHDEREFKVSDPLELSKAFLECGGPNPDGFSGYRWASFKDPVTGAAPSGLVKLSTEEYALVGLCLKQSGLGSYFDNLCKLKPELSTCQPGQFIPNRSLERRMSSVYCQKQPSWSACK